MQPEKKVFILYRSALVSIFENKIILLPFLTIAFLQLLIIETLYFYPRYPLKTFFEPLITKLWSPVYMHYPHNLAFLPKLFEDANIFLYVFVSSLLICAAIYIISAINQGIKITMGGAIKYVLSRYVHIVLAALIIFLMIWGFQYVYDLVSLRAMKIRSETGKFYILKRVILDGRPYFSLLINIIVGAIWGYLFQFITLGKKNIFKAIFHNFRVLWGSFWFTFFVVFWPSVAVASIFLLRSAKMVAANPELSVSLLSLGMFANAMTDALIFASLTIYYLTWTEARKEQQ